MRPHHLHVIATVSLLSAVPLLQEGSLLRGANAPNVNPVLPPEDAPPLHTWNTDRNVPQTWRTPSPRQRGRVWYSTVRKVVEVDWDAASAFPEEGVPPGPVSGALQKFAVAYFPTDVVVLDKSTLLVAGKHSGTETVIERWSFKWPAKMPQTDIATDVVPVALPELLKREEIYRGDIAGQRIVQKMARVRTDVNRALIHFDDSTDLYELNLTTHTFKVVASVEGTAPVGPVPGLGDRHQFIWSGDHAQWGHVYVFGTLEPTGHSTPRPDALVFSDLDRDGTLDSVQSIPIKSWALSDFADGRNYISLE